MWIDKFCIDQTDIESSLLCLPVYLASCKQLVICAGDTYTSRLWCVMELFTYMIMGGSTDQIEVLLLPTDQEGRDALIAQFRKFDARQAVCFLQEDTDRLQNTIEGGFGSLAAFSSSVTNVLEFVSKTTTNQSV